MTKNEFISILRNPSTLSSEVIPDLKEMIELYPYFSIPRLLLSKIYHTEDNVNSQRFINKSAIYAPDRSWLFYFLNPEKAEKQENKKQLRENRFSGNYFDMLQSVESNGEDTKQSLQKLAEKLKEARSRITVENQNNKPQPKVKNNAIKEFEEFMTVEHPKTENTEENARKLIKEKKYREAIVILNELYFNNPKKRIYFADQIRFLEKVLENSKK